MDGPPSLSIYTRHNASRDQDISSGSGIETKRIPSDTMPVEEKPHHPLLNVLPVVTSGKNAWRDVRSLRAWTNPHLWRAGILEACGSCVLAFGSSTLGITLSSWPRAAVPAGIFFGNTALVSLIVFATATTTGAHINPIVTISTTFSGLCHPVRAAVYIICQLIGAVVGGFFIRIGMGLARAVELHNGGCWVDPSGPVSVGQAVALEFMACFCLLFLAYGIGLDPRQGQFYGPSLGPLFVGLTVGLMTSLTGTLSEGYGGAGMFPGRCFGLAAGIGTFQSTHWIWWVPDVAACLVHSIVYRVAPPYRKEYVMPSSPTIRREDAAIDV